MPARPKHDSHSSAPRAFLVWLLLLVVPLVAVGPALLPGARLLSQLPVAFPPLALEYPTAAAAAQDGMNLSTSDRLFPALSDQLEARRQLATGTLPTWDPHLGLGMPLFGGSIAGLAYPPNWLGLLLPPDLTAGYLALLALFLAGLGLFKFLQLRGLGFEAALGGALVLQASLWGFTNLHDYMKVDAALWTPWLLYGVEGVRQGRRRALLTIALSGGLALLAGFYPIALFGLTTAGLYALFTLARRPRALGRALAGFALALGIGAWQVLPALEASEHSLRQAGGADAMAAQALPFEASAALLVPDLFGTPEEVPLAAIDPAAAALVAPSRDHTLEYASALEWNLHFGSLALLFSLLALLTRPRAALAPTALLVLWFGFGQAWPGFRWLYHVPGLDLGAPGRALAMAWPLFAWLAAIGIEALAREAARLRQWRDPHRAATEGARREPILVTVTTILIGVTAMIGGLLLWSLLEPAAVAAPLQEALAARHGKPLAEVLALVPAEAIERTAERVHRTAGAWFATGLLFVALGVFVRIVAGRTLLGRGTLAMVLALAIGLAPRLASGAFEFPLHQVALFAFGSGVVGLLCLHAASTFRRDVPEWDHAGWEHNALALMLVTGLAIEALDVAPRHLQPRHVGSDASLALGATTRRVPLAPPSEALDAILATTGAEGRVLRIDASPSGVEEVVALARPNMLTMYGVRELTPYVVFTPRTLIELATLGAARPFRSGITAPESLAATNRRLLDLLRVNTVLSTRPLESQPGRSLELRWSGQGFHVYGRGGAMPTALLVPEAVRSTDDAAVLERLAAPDFVPRKELLLAPEVDLPAGAVLVNEPDPDAEVEVRRPAANRLDVQVKTAVGGWLLITEQYMPDWKVNLDGADAVTLRANHALRALWIPPGEHLVRTWYEPWSLRYGFVLMLLSLVLAVWFSRRGRA